MENHNLVMEYINKPLELEKLYRESPIRFNQQFLDALKLEPESDVLKVWNVRLNYEQSQTSKKNSIQTNDLLIMGLFALLSGIVTRVLFYFIDLGMITPINLVFGIVPLLLMYLILVNKPSIKLSAILFSILIVIIVYVNLISNTVNDSIILSYLHLPILLWILVGLAYVGNEYKSGNARLAYLKFNGEFLILYAIMAISGIILTGITMQLFSIIDLDIAEFYFSNIVLIGASSLMFVATFLVMKSINLTKNIAPYIAKIFSPLVLITLIVYLFTVLIMGKNPFIDRDFLLTFNVILILVLAITIFSITERQSQNKNISDVVNIVLIVIALIIDSIALSAIVFRLTSYGITPNRLAVLGINILIFVNLIWIMFAYLGYLKNNKQIEQVQNAVTHYLPIYGIWAALVTFIFPIVFR